MVGGGCVLKEREEDKGLGDGRTGSERDFGFGSALLLCTLDVGGGRWAVDGRCAKRFLVCESRQALSCLPSVPCKACKACKRTVKRGQGKEQGVCPPDIVYTPITFKIKVECSLGNADLRIFLVDCINTASLFCGFSSQAIFARSETSQQSEDSVQTGRGCKPQAKDDNYLEPSLPVEGFMYCGY